MGLGAIVGGRDRPRPAYCDAPQWCSPPGAPPARLTPFFPGGAPRDFVGRRCDQQVHLQILDRKIARPQDHVSYRSAQVLSDPLKHSRTARPQDRKTMFLSDPLRSFQTCPMTNSQSANPFHAGHSQSTNPCSMTNSQSGNPSTLAIPNQFIYPSAMTNSQSANPATLVNSQSANLPQ